MSVMSPVWIAIPATDVARAVRFYATVFNLPFRGDINLLDANTKFMSFDFNPESNVGGGILKVPDSTGILKTGPGGACPFWFVPDVEKIGEAIENAGGKVLTDIEKEGTTLLMRYFEDTEGNTGGVHQNVQSS